MGFTILCGAVGGAGQEGLNPAPLGDPAVDGRAARVTNFDAQEEAARMRRIAAKERQKKIASDTMKLVKLATEVKVAVAQPALKETPLDVVRKTDQIEKLAHDLKVRMMT